jgi:hypothetical protein
MLCTNAQKTAFFGPKDCLVAKNEPQRVKEIAPSVKSLRFYHFGMSFDLTNKSYFLRIPNKSD